MSSFRRNIMMFTRPVESQGVPAPTISPASGSIVYSQTITISIEGSAVSAEYSFDNSTWVAYTSPFTLSSNTTVYARALDAGGNYSNVTSNSYVILPYDAQVEYLESNGIQYIDTNIYFSVGLSINITAQYTNNFSETQLLVCATASGGCWLGNVSINGGSFGIGANSNQVVGSSNIKTDLVLSFPTNNQTQLVGNNITRTIKRSTNPTTTIIYLFARGTGYFSHARIYSCSIEGSNSTLRDFIPVRVGQIGYMYDKVSGQLFGNSGTGNFVLGNDVN